MRRITLASALTLAWVPLLFQAIRVVVETDILKSWNRLIDSGHFDEQLVVSAVSLVVIMMTISVSIEVVRLVTIHGLGGAIREVGSRTIVGLVLLGISSFLSVLRSSSSDHGPSDGRAPSLNVEQVSAGLSSSAVLIAIRRLRIQQMSSSPAGTMPVKLSEESMETTMLLVSSRDRHLQLSTEQSERVSRLYDEVETYEAMGHRAQCERNGMVLVRLYGFPLVENVDGRLAHFRKARALELISWLVLNRDRMRRSAARTAMWEMNCTDATFSTVVSDLRRALIDLTSKSGDELLPVTFSDELPLIEGISSDFDLLLQNQVRFRSDPEKYRDRLVSLLRGVRDLPFAGTSYLWPDLDGSTTRLVVSAVGAAQELATWAVEVGDTEALMVSTTAGLRLLPGDEQLLELQRSHLARR